MNATHGQPAGDSNFWDRSIDSDELLDLQCKVLEALEEGGHPSFKAADRDPALKDSATDGQRKAWLAVYGPLTDVLS